MTDTNLLILYGSQTGTGEDVAERIAREGMQRGLLPMVSSMNDIGVDGLSNLWRSRNKVVVFIAATTGQGDTPDNMKNFWKALCRSSLDEDCLREINYGVVGLGDSSYEKYNFVGKKLFRRLKQLGANPLLDVCLGDDQHDLGYHAAVNPWIEKLWTIVPEYCNVDGTNGNDEILSKFVMINCVNVKDQTFHNFVAKLGPRELIEMRRVVGNERVTSANHWQDTRLITLDLQHSLLKFSPGDVLTIQPANLRENTDKFYEIFPHLLTAPPVYLAPNPKLPWSKISPEIVHLMGPQPWPWSLILYHILDIQSVPRQYFFELMATFATDELEKEKLLEFCSPKGQEDLFAYCNRPKRNILEVFQDFPKTTKLIPPVYLFDLIPCIKPRSFSIASSRSQFPDRVQILVAVVEYQTKIKAKRKGLCSNWLAHECHEGAQIPVWIQKGSFKLPPPDENAAVIMVGPGTGVAPFRSIISDRMESWNKWLFFGCRNEANDCYFIDEWIELQQRNHLNFRCAYSRDSDGQKRDYVQDKILQESENLKKVLTTNNFYIYVAGNAKQMPKDVQSVILQLMTQAGVPDAENFMEQCSKLGRYQTETWS